MSEQFDMLAGAQSIADAFAEFVAGRANRFHRASPHHGADGGQLFEAPVKDRAVDSVDTEHR